MSSASSSSSLRTCDVRHDRPISPALLRDLVFHHATGDRIEPRGRLVEKERGWREQECQRGVDLLPRTAGQHAERLSELRPQTEASRRALRLVIPPYREIAHHREQVGAGEIVGKSRDLRHVADARAILPASSIARPSTRIVPESGRVRPRMLLMSVVLPAPFGPTIAVTRPAR